MKVSTTGGQRGGWGEISPTIVFSSVGVVGGELCFTKSFDGLTLHIYEAAWTSKLCSDYRMCMIHSIYVHSTLLTYLLTQRFCAQNQMPPHTSLVSLSLVPLHHSMLMNLSSLHRMHRIMAEKYSTLLYHTYLHVGIESIVV